MWVTTEVPTLALCSGHYLGISPAFRANIERFASAALPEHRALQSSSNHPSVSSGVTDLHHLVVATPLPFSTENSEGPVIIGMVLRVEFCQAFLSTRSGQHFQPIMFGCFFYLLSIGPFQIPAKRSALLASERGCYLFLKQKCFLNKTPMNRRQIKQNKAKSEFLLIGNSIKLYLNFLESASEPSNAEFKYAVRLWKQKCRQIKIPSKK